MRKTLRVMVLALIVTILTLSSVSANDLTESITASDGLGGVISFEKTYNSEKDVNELLVKLTVTEESINKILTQAPGNSSEAASLGTFYITLKPGLAGNSFQKYNWFFTKNTNIDEAIEKVDTEISKETVSTYDSVWPCGLYIQYYDANTEKWVIVGDTSNGGKTIKANLMEKLNLSEESELKYGVNFRFFMYENYYWLYGWKTAENTEYIKVSYAIEFPVTAKVEGGDVYYPSLESALTSESKNIIVNKNITVNNNITIPEGTTITIVDGVTVELAEDVTLTNNGTILGALKKGENTEVYHSATVDEPKNAEVSLEENSYASNNEVKVVVKLDDGYELSKVQILDGSGKDITDTVNYDSEKQTFTMPNCAVKVVVETAAIPYKFVEGEKATYENKDLTFKLDGPLELFDKVYVNGEELPEDSYSLKSGSTILTIKNEYLSTLKAETYTLKVAYTNGTSDETTFTIAEAEQKPVEDDKQEEKPVEDSKKEENPATSDAILLYVVIALVSVIGLSGSIIYLNKSKKSK